jgi:hypothetical protein
VKPNHPVRQWEARGRNAAAAPLILHDSYANIASAKS